MSEEKESQIDKAKKLTADKKAAQSYLKSKVEELDRSLAQNYAKGNFTIAAHDARRMAAMLDVLGDVDVTG